MKSRSLLALFFCIPFVTQAQEYDLPLRAMKDELERNMKELVLEGYERPFFINYGMNDEFQFQATASMGALLKSNLSHMRTKTSVRVLVGNYEFNDESFDVPGALGVSSNMELALPLDDDYEGIRRSFWSTTDMVYKGAAKKYKKNVETLAEVKKDLKELSHRRFAQTKPCTFFQTENSVVTNREEMENYIRSISAVFKKYPTIKSSGANLYQVTGHYYFVNSEGSIVKKPMSLISLAVPIQIKSEKGELISDAISILAPRFEELPTAEQVIRQVEELVSSLLEVQQAPKLEEEYSGPVLFIGAPVADLFEKRIFSSEDRILANNSIAPLKGFQFESGNAGNKIGKPTFAEGITIKVTPKRKTFEGRKLLGSFEVDAEGVEPAEETLVVEKGILKTYLSDRSLTDSTQRANGLGLQQGVIDVSFANTSSLPDLKAKLIAQAKKEGLDFALIVSDFSAGQGGLSKVYRLWVKDGREELIQQVSIKPISSKDFKKISGATTQQEVHQWRSGFASNNTISFIVPAAILVDEVEADTGRSVSLKEEEYVTNPLKK